MWDLGSPTRNHPISPALQGRFLTSGPPGKSQLFKFCIYSTLATSCEKLTHWKRLWCWEGLGEGGEGDDRGWDGWMASQTWWMWVWVSSGSWWWTGRPGILWFMGSQRVGHDRVTELNWIFHCVYVPQLLYPFICQWASTLLPSSSYCK